MIMIRTTCLCRFGRRYPLSCRMMDHTETIVASCTGSATCKIEGSTCGSPINEHTPQTISSALGKRLPAPGPREPVIEISWFAPVGGGETKGEEGKDGRDMAGVATVLADPGDDKGGYG